MLNDNSKKQIVIDSLEFLSVKELIDVFGLVIMPNHIHLIWRMNSLNGNETPFGSFLKFTAHEFKKSMLASELKNYVVNAPNKVYEFWQRDSLAIELHSPEVAYQKLEYIHHNPLAKKWKLCNETIDYEFSSASFYESGESTFAFLKHLGEEF